MERCESGLIGRPGKSVCQQWHRGFESLSLRNTVFHVCQTILKEKCAKMIQ